MRRWAHLPTSQIYREWWYLSIRSVEADSNTRTINQAWQEGSGINISGSVPILMISLILPLISFPYAAYFPCVHCRLCKQLLTRRDIFRTSQTCRFPFPPSLVFLPRRNPTCPPFAPEPLPGWLEGQLGKLHLDGYSLMIFGRSIDTEWIWFCTHLQHE